MIARVQTIVMIVNFENVLHNTYNTYTKVFYNKVTKYFRESL